MTAKQQCIALYTLVRREVVRMLRIASQVFLPPVISTGLYFLIFGSVIGGRIGQIHGMSYSKFIAPGLILMAVISNAYANVSTSLFSLRFQKSIEELLVSPMPNSLILLGYVLGGVVRSMLVACMVFGVASFFLDLPLATLPLTLGVILLVSTLFSLAGFTNALVARNFDDVMIIPTFVLTPLTYLGGVFYAISMLPPFWQKVSQANPIVYMMHAMRYAMLGQQESNWTLSISIICLLLFGFIVLNLVLLKKGVGLRD